MGALCDVFNLVARSPATFHFLLVHSAPDFSLSASIYLRCISLWSLCGSRRRLPVTCFAIS